MIQKAEDKAKDSSIVAKLRKEHQPYFRNALFLSVFVAALPVAPIAFMRLTFGPVLYSDSVAYLLWLLLILIAALTLAAALEWVRDRIIMAGSISFVSKLEKIVFSTVFEDSSREWTKGATIINDLRTIRTFLASQVAGAILDAPFAIFWLLVIFFIHPFMGLLSIFGAVLALIVGVIVEKKVEPEMEKAGEHQSTSRSELTSYFQNLNASLAMGTLPNLYDRWNKSQSSFLLSQATASAQQSFGGALTRVIMLVQGSMLLGLGTLLMLLEIMPIGMAGNLIIAKFIGALAMRPMMTAVMSWKNIVAARQAYENVDIFLQENPAVKKQMKLPKPKGVIQITNASVYADDSDKKILDQISLQANPGSVTIVLGESGAGKTTLAKLLVGFREPSAGSVRLDGVSVFNWDKAELGPHLGYLPQNIELFGGTMVENICRFEKPDQEKLKTACKRAGLNYIYEDYLNNTEHSIDPDSMTVSGGMRQKLGIARAFYGDPKLLVLDEPTSSLDSESEDNFIAAIMEFQKTNATIFIMTHNKKILKAADHILVLFKGRQKIFDTKTNIAKKMRMSQLEETN
tara:strand:+ start:34268 stop:35986 length:1719 start_codon:yes stop_codon:yes gene_type:complete